MNVIKSELEKRLKRKRAEIDALESEVERFEDSIADRKDRIAILEITYQELQSLYNLIPSEADADGSSPAFRQNSDGALVHQILREAGEPLYVDAILDLLEREITVESRGSLAGQLGGYVRKGQVFTRPAPNTFGLREWELSDARKTTEEVRPIQGKALSLEEIEGDLDGSAANNNELAGAA